MEFSLLQDHLLPDPNPKIFVYSFPWPTLRFGSILRAFYWNKFWCQSFTNNDKLYFNISTPFITYVNIFVLRNISKWSFVLWQRQPKKKQVNIKFKNFIHASGTFHFLNWWIDKTESNVCGLLYYKKKPTRWFVKIQPKNV